MTGLILACASLALAQATSDNGSSAQAGSSPPSGGGQGWQAVVTTVDDGQVSGRILAVADGKLQLATEPPRVIPLEDVSRIELGHRGVPAASGELKWMGQDNQDLVQVGSASGGNGVQDLHLRATNLKPRALKQIVVTCRFSKRARMWRLDTSLSSDWRLAVVRADQSPEGDLYLEPDAFDSHGQLFDAAFTYDDDSTTTSSVVATTRTSDQLKIDKGTKPGQAPAAGEVPSGASKPAVYLAADGQLQGEIRHLSPDLLTLSTAWQTDLPVPLVRVRGLWFGQSGPAGARADFDRQLAAPANEDVVFLLAPDQTAASVQGSVRSLSNERLTVHFEGADRGIKQQRLLGIVFAAQAKRSPTAELQQVFRLRSGEVLAAKWLGLERDQLDIELPWNARAKIPVEQVSEVRTRNGKLTYLSDLEPIAVEETAYFGRVISWRRDTGFAGQGAKVKGQPVTRCLAMHSRSVLTYALDGQYEQWKSSLAFDDSAGTRGRVACRVLVDGREVFARPDFRSTDDVQSIDLPVAGAQQLTLEVDFGKDEDTGDRIVWGEPRLFRAAK
jgi:hypothetical protein